MAAFLKPFRFAWKELDEALNKIANALNNNAPLEGNAIHLDEKGGSGTSINWSDPKGKQANSSNQQQAQADSHQLITEMDWLGVKWQDVVIVDPVSCHQTTITVFTYTGNSNDVVKMTLGVSLWANPS
jgi:hypothetical protein